MKDVIFKSLNHLNKARFWVTLALLASLMACGKGGSSPSQPHVPPPKPPDSAEIREKIYMDYLSKRPIAPDSAVRKVYYPGIYAKFSPFVPGPDKTEEEALQALKDYASTDIFLKDSMAELERDFSSPALARKVQTPALRAALVAARYYPGGKAMYGYIMHLQISGPVFQYGQTSGGLVDVIPADSGQLVKYIIDQNARGDIERDPFSFIPVSFHDPVAHQDRVINRTEERLGFVTQAMAYIYQLMSHPERIEPRSIIDESNNSKVLGLFNSGLMDTLSFLQLNNGNVPIYPENPKGIPAIRYADLPSLLATPNSAKAPSNITIRKVLVAQLHARLTDIPDGNFDDVFAKKVDEVMKKASVNSRSRISRKFRATVLAKILGMPNPPL